MRADVAMVSSDLTSNTRNVVAQSQIEAILHYLRLSLLELGKLLVLVY